MEHLAAPLFNSWAEFIGSPLSHQMILCLRENQSYWKSQLEDRQKLVDNSVDQEKTEEQAHGKAKGHRDHSGSRSRTPKANRRISLPAQNGSYINDSRGKQRRISLPICYYGAAVTKWSVMLKGERNFQDLCEIESFDQRNEVDIQQATPPPPISLPLCSLTCNHESTAVGPILRVSHSVGEFVSQKTTELTKKMSSSSFAVLDDIYESGCSPKSDCFDCRMDTTGETPVVNLNTVPDGKLRKCRRHSAPVLFQPNGLWRIYVDSRQTDSTPPNVKLTASTGVCASDVCSDEWKWCRQGRRSSAPIATAPISASATKSTEISSSNHNPSESNGDHLVTAVG